MPPPIGTVASTTLTSTGGLEVTWSIPAPSGGETTATEVHLWRRDRRPGGEWSDLFRRKTGLDAADGSWVDGTGVEKMQYEFGVATVDADGDITYPGPAWEDLDTDLEWGDVDPAVSWDDLMFHNHLEA